MNTKRIVTIGVIALVLTSIALVLLKNKKQLDTAKQPVDRSHIAVSVTVDTAALHTVNENFAQPATLVAKDDAEIPAETSGKLVSLNIELGAAVAKGQTVGRVDVTETQQKLDAVNLTIEKLTRDLERSKVLVSANATNANATVDAKYDLDSKKLEAAQLRTQISRANIVSPISGIITDKKKLAGEYVGAGTAVASVTSLSALKASVNVPEGQIFNVRKGQVALVTASNFPDENFRGMVSYISPKGDDNHNYTVEVTLQGNAAGKLKAGLYVNVAFEGTASHQSLLMIPKAALAEGVKNAYVYVYKDGKAEERKLSLGAESGDFVEVKEGLATGELVITSGQINLTNGSKAEIVKRSNQ